MNLFSKTSNCFTGWTGTVVILAAILSSGCSSMDKPASASFASVVIANQTPEKIHQATIAVFQDNGYHMIPQSDDSLVFQREATRGETIDYAGFVGAQQGEQVAMRVRVQIVAKDASAYWLQCKAYAVRSPDQPVFENTTALFNFQSKPYQKLMDQVAEKLAVVAPTP